jgi:hypothetical protein
MRTYLLVYVMCAVPIGYMLARSVGGWKGDNVVAAVQRYFGDERAQSMEFRFNNETLLLDRAAEHRAFGWGLTGKFLILKEDGTIESVPDGLWVIAIGTTGLFGLFSLYGALLLPLVLLGRRIRAEAWGGALFVGPSVMAVLIAMHAIDNLINAMINPLFILALGGLTGLVAYPLRLPVGPAVAARAPGMPRPMGAPSPALAGAAPGGRRSDEELGIS